MSAKPTKSGACNVTYLCAAADSRVCFMVEYGEGAGRCSCVCHQKVKVKAKSFYEEQREYFAAQGNRRLILTQEKRDG